MNIKERLRELDRRPTPDAPPGVTAPAPYSDAANLYAAITASRAGFSCQWETNITLKQLAVDGCFVVEWQIPLAEVIAGSALYDLRRLSGKWLAVAGKDDRLAALEMPRTLFVDTETTGLAGGTGSVAFLIGVGFLHADDFVVRQYFIRDFHEEAAMLHLFSQQVMCASGVVTFNGRTFDIPLLNSRYILNRSQAVFEGLPHLDLLFAARRIWGDTVTPCSLGELERIILRIQRHDDVPGALVPHIYFEYLHSGNTADLPQVFHHNRLDIISMAALLLRVCRMIEDPLATTSTAERRRLAVLFRKVRHLERSIKVLESLVAQDQHAQGFETFAELALCYKRSKRHDDACRLWQRAIDQFAFHPLPYIELAKHHEHRLRDIARALALTERALRALHMRQELAGGSETDFYRVDLEKRRRRLQRKHNDQQKWRSS